MGKQTRAFDVCVVCALPEEAKAFLEVIQQQCEQPIESHISQRYGYSSRLATITNDQGEPLTLHLSWLPRYGPAEMTLHLSRVLEECQPRLAVMTGICAGDSQQVHLGDLVVAERTFTYDNGKVTLDEQGRRVHLHDTMTYQLDANLLQFLGLLDAWQPLVARLRRPPSPPGERRRRKMACHIKPLASGSAVRADAPFAEVRAPVRGTVAIDMEGAAFGLVMSRHPGIPWLIVKGVSDYADRAKNDAYHGYAARASAHYALRFIRAYLSGVRLPPREGPSSTSQADLSGVWNVPFARNPYFTGRDDLLERLDQLFTPTEQKETRETRRAALTQPRAIKGLGGIGKTQVAVEYAYRSRERGRYTHTLWVNAASEETIIASFVEIAEVLPSFLAKGETDQRQLVEAVKRWLEQCEQPWLLIFDNADADDFSFVQSYFPKRGSGSILLTTRADAVGSIAASIEVEKMGFMEGSCFLLRRAYGLADLPTEEVFEHVSDEKVNEAGNIVVELDHFPLALDQAGAYIEETRCSLSHYLELYRTHSKVLRALRGKQSTNYPESVATTWEISFQKVRQGNPAATELLHLCAFLAPDAIPEELISMGTPYWPPPLQQTAADPLAFDRAVARLLAFSLVKRDAEGNTLSVHRLVQAVLLDTLEQDTQRAWAERVILAVNAVFPPDPTDVATWPQCLRYLDQVQACHTLIASHGLLLAEAADVLNRAGLYLNEHALYALAEPLYRHALAIRERRVGETHPDTATSLGNLASLYKNQGRYAEAEPLYQRALAIDEHVFETQPTKMATDLNNLAHLYVSQGRYAEAEPLYQRALAVFEQRLGPHHKGTATCLNNLAFLYVTRGRYAEAEPLYQRVLAIREQQVGREHPDTATSLSNLADLYKKQGKYAEAEPLYQRALGIRELQLGRGHPDTAFILHDLADLYEQQGKYAEAEALYQRAVAAREQWLGPDHPDLAGSLDSLAGLYEKQGKYAEAEALYQRALALYERRLGPSHPNTGAGLNNLANLYLGQGKPASAEPLYQRALAIFEQHLGETHPNTASALAGLAACAQDQGRDAEAESLYQRVLHMREQTLGPEHPYVALSLNDLALLYQQQDRYAEAEPLYRRALAIYQKQAGPPHPRTATTLSNLADSYARQGKYAEAEPLCRDALVIREQQLGREHPKTATSLGNLAFLCEKQGKDGEAELLYQRALDAWEHILGPEHPDVAFTLTNLALLYEKQGRYAEAECLFQRALAIRERGLGAEHIGTAASLNNLAGLYERWKKYPEAEPLYRRALSIDEKLYGGEHREVAYDARDLARVCVQQGKNEEAEPLYQQALSIFEQQVGSEHPATQEVREEYAAFLRARGRDAEAAALEKSREQSV
jgi:tetratricopeptide (TPR) repeat protein/nucleoside phosphorylase